MNQRIRVSRGGRRRGRQPYRQGDLDGLCGVYSIVNAVRALCPELDQDGAEWLFAHLMQALSKQGVDLSIAVASGIGRVDQHPPRPAHRRADSTTLERSAVHGLNKI